MTQELLRDSLGSIFVLGIYVDQLVAHSTRKTTNTNVACTRQLHEPKNSTAERIREMIIAIEFIATYRCSSF